MEFNLQTYTNQIQDLKGELTGVETIENAIKSLRDIANRLEAMSTKRDRAALLPSVSLEWKLDPSVATMTGRGKILWSLKFERYDRSIDYVDIDLSPEHPSSDLVKCSEYIK